MIVRSYNARMRYINSILKAVLGDGKDTPEPIKVASRPMTVRLFDALFGGKSE